MKNIIFPILLLSIMSCKTEQQINKIKLITIDPGHFHAALVQKTMYEDVDSTVYVYGPEGNDIQYHLDRIEGFNSRAEDPTRWHQEVYKGADFFAQMIKEKKGNVVVLSGNNQKKTEYIMASLQNGLSVLADKPMVINYAGFEQLIKAFETAKDKNLLLYDIMTERFEINTMLQKELSQIPEIFGTLEQGSLENPAITKESVHHLFKYVSGNVLVRPTWFLDTNQQGEGIVDVMTHLVDLVQWECFPDQIIDYKKDIDILNAKRWATKLIASQFKEITKWDNPNLLFPEFLSPNVKADSTLDVFCNGEINYKLKGVHAKTSVKWDYKAPEGTGDTHYSIMRGTKCNLVIRQGKEENYQATLYIEPVGKNGIEEMTIQNNFKSLDQDYPGLSYIKSTNGWIVKIPVSLKEGHEAHFARVTQNFLSYYKNKNMPSWEIPNMIAKYYTTTKALEMVGK
jgi:predicted dehydrogenase